MAPMRLIINKKWENSDSHHCYVSENSRSETYSDTSIHTASQRLDDFDRLEQRDQGTSDQGTTIPVCHEV